MHTAIATGVGLLFLGCVIELGRAFGFARQTTVQMSVGLWLVASLAHGALGLAAGQTLFTEVVVWLMVFGVPVAALFSISGLE